MAGQSNRWRRRAAHDGAVEFLRRRARLAIAARVTMLDGEARSAICADPGYEWKVPADRSVQPEVARRDARAPGAGSAADERRIDQAIALARQLVDEATRLEARQGRRERRHRARMRALVRDADAADFTVRLTDEVPRIPVAATAARRFFELVDHADLRGFGWLDRFMLHVGARLAAMLPRLVMPLVVRRLRLEAAAVILPADDPALRPAPRAHGAPKASGATSTSSARRSSATTRPDAGSTRSLARLRRPDVDYVSVKISAICAGVSPLAFDAHGRSDRRRGSVSSTQLAASCDPPEFVNLDMEEYRDLDLTVAAFRAGARRARARAPRRRHRAPGVPARQSTPSPARLGEWADRRRARGGGRIKVRLVKGANLAMETVEAEMRGWEPAPVRLQARRRRQLQGGARRPRRPVVRRSGRHRRRRATTCSTWRGRSACARS